MRTLPLISHRVVHTFGVYAISHGTNAIAALLLSAVCRNAAGDVRCDFSWCLVRRGGRFHFMFIAPKHKKILKFIRRMTKLVNDALYIHARRAHIAKRQWIFSSIFLLFRAPWLRGASRRRIHGIWYLRMCRCVFRRYVCAVCVCLVCESAKMTSFPLERCTQQVFSLLF